MLAAGFRIAIRRPSSTGRAALLGGAGVFWILSPIEFMGLSTLFVHRPLLAAAAWVPAFDRYGWRRTSIPLAAFAAVSVIATLADAYWLTFGSWLAVVAVSVVPGRRTLWPVLAAETVMLSAASLGHLGGWFTDGDRQWTYYAAALALVWFVVVDATRLVTLDSVLDASVGSAGLSVGFRAAGDDEYRTPAGDVLEIESAARVVRVELDDLGSAALLHDDPAFDDPAVRVQVERVMRLLANNVALLRQVDEQRRAMEDSRRRLLEADQHAAEVLLDDVGSDVLPHLSHIAKALSDCGVPDDHKASVLLVQIRNELRSLSTGLGPDVLRDGLPAALRELVDGSAIPGATRPVSGDSVAASRVGVVHGGERSGRQRRQAQCGQSPHDRVAPRRRRHRTGGQRRRLWRRRAPRRWWFGGPERSGPASRRSFLGELTDERWDRCARSSPGGRDVSDWLMARRRPGSSVRRNPDRAVCRRFARASACRPRGTSAADGCRWCRAAIDWAAGRR